MKTAVDPSPDRRKSLLLIPTEFARPEANRADDSLHKHRSARARRRVSAHRDETPPRSRGPAVRWCRRMFPRHWFDAAESSRRICPAQIGPAVPRGPKPRQPPSRPPATAARPVAPSGRALPAAPATRAGKYPAPKSTTPPGRLLHSHTIESAATRNRPVGPPRRASLFRATDRGHPTARRPSRPSPADLAPGRAAPAPGHLPASAIARPIAQSRRAARCAARRWPGQI